MTTLADTGDETKDAARTAKRAERIRLLIQPALVLVIVAILLVYALTRDLTATPGFSSMC